MHKKIFGFVVPQIQHNQRQDRMILAAILVLSTIFTILLYSLPDDALLRYPVLRQGVDSIANIAPAINNLREYSTFPQLAATSYALGILLWLILSIYFSIYLPFNKVVTSNNFQIARNFLIVLSVDVLFIYLFFNLFPGNGFKPSASSTRLTRLILSMLENRVGFAVVTATIFVITATLISSTWMHIKIVLRSLFKN